MELLQGSAQVDSRVDAAALAAQMLAEEELDPREGERSRVVAERDGRPEVTRRFVAFRHERPTSHDLAANERVGAIWKLSGESIAHALALVDLLERGYTGRTWPAMRAIHEADRLLVAVTDPDEERIVWWSSEARGAEQRQAERVAEQMRKAGIEPVAEDVK
jgi:hypothetical protein